MLKEIVPRRFEVPLALETPQFRLRMVSIKDVDKDYETVMSNISHLKGTFGPTVDWPPDDLSPEQELIDLAWHQKEFQIRRAFAYTVMSLDESRYLGCVYIYPSNKQGFDAVVLMWVIESEVKTGLDEEVYQTVKKWIKEKWPFKKRCVPWQRY